MSEKVSKVIITCQIYSETNNPKNDYPYKLAKYISSNYFKKSQFSY